MSRANQFSVHRDGIKLISAQAVADDETLEYTAKFLQVILKEAPTTLVTLKTPQE